MLLVVSTHNTCTVLDNSLIITSVCVCNIFIGFRGQPKAILYQFTGTPPPCPSQASNKNPIRWHPSETRNETSPRPKTLSAPKTKTSSSTGKTRKTRHVTAQETRQRSRTGSSEASAPGPRPFVDSAHIHTQREGVRERPLR